MDYVSYSIFGRGPQRRQACHKKVYRNRPTEFHEDLFSFGRTNRSRRLSDGEFYHQVGQEVCYLGSQSARHFGNAARSFCELLELIFA